jgi:hypothetical protein
MTIAQRAALTSVLYIAAQALCLFGGAGRIDIPEFWIYLALTTALFVASIWLVDPDLAAAIGAAAIPLLLWRCIGEDRMLRAGLPGYADRVPWRLVPGMW